MPSRNVLISTQLLLFLVLLYLPFNDAGFLCHFFRYFIPSLQCGGDSAASTSSTGTFSSSRQNTGRGDS
uniref:Secreted peptide n=1 Tax=Trichobilharzia regenti TaxID=157069 RepID=A0AA85IXG8_TRIRE|nr:unnamed protein product [Trichobilharzia regenti]